MTKVRVATMAASLPLRGARRLRPGAFIPPGESWQETVGKVRVLYSPVGGTA